MEAAKSTSRQLSRRRREPRGQRQEELSFPRMPDRRITIAVVRSPAGGRFNNSRTTVRSWTSAVKPQPVQPPPPLRQMLPSKAFGGHSGSYKKPSLASQRTQPEEPVSDAPVPKNHSKRQHHQQHTQPNSSTWWRAIPVKAKVDSHWLKPHHHHRSSRDTQPVAGPGPKPGVRKNKSNKSLEAAHEQLELMLSRIERARDFLPPPPAGAANTTTTTTTKTTSKKRGVPCPMFPIRSAAKFGEKMAKGASRHMAQPPPAPPGSPINSARREGSDSAEMELHLAAVPLAHNPQSLVPAKREALLELLQQREQHDRGIVDMVRNSNDGDQSARDTSQMMFQVLPLSLNESPYNGRDGKASVTGSGSVKESQELYQTSPQTEGYILPMVGQQRDGKEAVVIHMEEKIRELNDRQQQAMRERAELEQHKQLVTLCREKQRQRENRKQLAEIKKQQQRDGEVSKPQTTIQLKDPLASASIHIPVPFDPWMKLLQERDRFLGQCQRSYFYNNSRSPALWKIYARVASKLSSQLMDLLDAKIKQPID
ncbi:serine/arginine repetitive matrix protein 1 isoform X1 [Drosophila serrata]|uniref:serine/arginine repetitive matrix protein 1 isoform X1 n=1 Tax=Drosophila serrata TaxID=7274 RepID=UPI000A1D0931|nr:serine/arginine repetitive matrix protein 1 isoform X1 [Drosophila serrata]